ncbi:unnamed protein product [Arabidopsis arenosa]|uniref:Uncharacterized protein n=1 Tax=Arabidopsis arenosa TaxID=38785 RepID=A0A8S2A0X4_ARAAE|nr:unnamed protein product [Arabidopsis arenosa]
MSRSREYSDLPPSVIVIPGRGRGRGGELRGPSISAPVRETSPIAPQRVADQSILETETGPCEDGRVISSLMDYSEDEIDLVEAPIPIINLDEYEMVESEHETDATMWENYLILPDSSDSTFPGFGTIIFPIVLPNDDDDQIVHSEPVVSPVVPSVTYLSLPDSLFTALWREYDAIRREDTPRTDMEVPGIPAPAQ